MKKLLAWLNQAGNARFGSMSVRDILQGIYLAAGGAAGTVIYKSVVDGQIFTLAALLTAAKAAALIQGSYYIKQIFSNTRGTLGPEPKAGTALPSPVYGTSIDPAEQAPESVPEKTVPIQNPPFEAGV